MKQSQKQQKSLSNQALLDEYLTLKPHRAVERILTENDLAYCVELYNLLQQNVKNNTNQLRSVLYSKHENLHQCSEMIEKIQQFASKVQNIQQEIDSSMKAPIVEDDWQLGIRTELTAMQKIEQLMNEKKIYQALKQCKIALCSYGHNAQSFLLQNDPDAYYLDFLKVQIVQKLQEYLQTVPLRSQIISQTVSSLKQFMEITSIQSLNEYIQESVAPASQMSLHSPENCPESTFFSKVEQKVSILELLYETASESQSYPLSQDQIVEVIFKFKLLSIKQASSVLVSYENPQQKISHLYEKVFNYFSDLLQILDEVEKKGSLSNQKDVKISKLHKIFTLNIKKAVNHISELFISNQKESKKDSVNNEFVGENSSPALTFQRYFYIEFSELYEKLLESKEFLSKLNSVSDHFKKVCNCEQENKGERIDLVGIIKNLWKDFYQQMLEIISEKINPSKWNQLTNGLELPQELALFAVTQYSKLTSQKLTQYSKELQGFKVNFKELLIKSKSQSEKTSIVNYFLRLKLKINSACDTQALNKNQSIIACQGLTKTQGKNKSQHSARELILLYFLVAAYNFSWTDHANQTSLSSVFKPFEDYHEFRIPLFDCIDQNHVLFKSIDTYLDLNVPKYRISESEYIQKWQQQLDQLFASYCATSTHQLMKEPLKQLILALIKTKLHQIEAK